MGGGVKLGPLGTAATNRPIVPAPSDYDDGEISGMMIGRGNRSTGRKPAPVPLCPHKPHMLHGREPGLPRWETQNKYTLLRRNCTFKITSWVYTNKQINKYIDIDNKV
jgi:hypothetical protein